ncbi:hypothetical protein ACFX14_026140 [Malus domestica]
MQSLESLEVTVLGGDCAACITHGRDAIIGRDYPDASSKSIGPIARITEVRPVGRQQNLQLIANDEDKSYQKSEADNTRKANSLDERTQEKPTSSATNTWPKEGGFSFISSLQLVIKFHHYTAASGYFVELSIILCHVVVGKRSRGDRSFYTRICSLIISSGAYIL